MRVLALFLLLTSPARLLAGSPLEFRDPDCPACREAQKKYEKALEEYKATDAARNTARTDQDNALKEFEAAAAALKTTTDDRDDAMINVRNIRVKTDKNPQYIAAIDKQKVAVENVVSTRKYYDDAAADLNDKQKRLRATSEIAEDKSGKLKSENDNVIEVVTNNLPFIPLALAEQNKSTDKLVDNSRKIHDQIGASIENNNLKADQVEKEQNDRDKDHNVMVEQEITDSNTQCETIACQTPPAPKAFVAKPGGNDEKKGTPAKEPPKTDPAAPKPKDSVAAKKLLDDVLKKDPDNPAALSARALANAKMGNNNAACADAKAALRGNPSDPGAMSINSLYCRDGAGGPPKDIKANANALLASLKEPSALDASGSTRLGAAGAAAAITKNATRPAAGTDARGASWRADEAANDLRLGLYHDALAKAKDVLRLDPKNLSGHLLMAAAYKAMGNHQSALAAAEAGLLLDPGNLALLNMKANALNHLKDYRGALFAVGEALQANATDAAAYLNKAYALGGLGDKEGMLSALRTAATLDPRYSKSLSDAISAIANGDDLFALFADADQKSAVVPRRRKSHLVRYGLMAMGALASLALLMSLAPYFSGSKGHPEPMEGRELIAGQYELKEKLGEGGMGIVYEAFDHNLERVVAIKKMRPELQSRPEEWNNFLREARTVARLNHPYIVPVHDVFSEDDEVYMVLDFVDGQPLSSLLGEGRRLPLEKLQSLFGFVCQAVDGAHRSHVLHRDLKPSNIMVGKDGYAKVMDFGIARHAKETLSRLTAQDNSGTPAYMAPEQHLGHAVQASDIFSLGVCLYESATGTLPFNGPDFMAQKERRHYQPVNALADNLPPSFDLLINAALEPDPKKRLSEALEFEQALRDCKIS